MSNERNEMQELVDFVEKVVTTSEAQLPNQARELAATIVAEVVAEVSVQTASRALIDAVDPNAAAMADKITAAMAASR